MYKLHLHLLGEFRLEQAGQLINTVNTPRLQSLLAYLLLHRQAALARHQVAFQFWPDSSEKQAHTNLRKLLFQLRNALPTADDFLRQDHLTIQWRADAPFNLDVAELEQALARCIGVDGRPLPRPQPADLTRVANLYRGELLPGCFDEWILPIRQQLQRDVMQVLEQLISLSEHQREYRAGIRYAQHLLSLDRLHEAGYRRLMQLHALNGERAAALHDYHTCATLLQQELGVEPDEETQTLYQRLLNTGSNVDSQPFPISVRLPDAPFVGRSTEWRTLLSAWRQTQRGQAHFVSIAGEAGIGKTRLAEELMNWASAQGIRMARTRSYEAEGGLAYAPVTEWLRADAFKSALQKLDKAWLSEVARLLPELLAERTDLTPPLPLSETWQRQRFFEALSRAILADKTPCLLFIDDLQWCDSETLAWLRFLLRYEPRARLLLVGAWRSEAVDEAHPLQTLLRDLGSTNQLSTIELASLTAEETAALAQHIATHKLVAAETEQLFQVTEGHPLFVIETIRSQQIGNSQSQSPIANRSTEDFGVSAGCLPGANAHERLQSLPPKVQSVIQSRLAQLSSQARELAGLAATIGRRFTFAVLVHASHASDDGLVQALDELWQRRIIREQGTDAYDFSHDRIREVAYRGLSQARRRLLHRRVAEALEAVEASNLDQVCAQLAMHYEQAAILDKAMDYWRRAGALAASQYANDEAIHCFSKALALVPDTHDADIHDGLRFELLVQREAVYALQGKPELRLADLMLMQPLAQEILAKEPINTLPATHSVLLLGRYYHDTAQPEQAVALLQQAITLAQQHRHQKLEARGWSWLGYALFGQAKLAEARTALTQAITCAQGTVQYDVEAMAFEFLAAVSMFSGSKATVIDSYLQQALAGFSKSKAIHKQGIGRVLNKLGYLWVAQGEGDYELAKDYYERGLQCCREIGDRATESNIYRNLGVFFTCRGEYQQAIHYIQLAIQLDRARKDIDSEGCAQNYLAVVYLNSGNYEISRQTQENALSHLKRSKAHGWICMVWSEISLMHWLQGEYIAARESAEQALRLAQKVGDSRQVGYSLTRLGRALNGLGCYPEAAVAFHEAYALHCDLEQFNRSMEPLAGLALNALHQHDLAQAILHVKPILSHLQTRQLDRTDETLHVYMACYRALQATNDSRAADLLQMAYAQVQMRAASLETDNERKLFWSAPIHAEVLGCKR